MDTINIVMELGEIATQGTAQTHLMLLNEAWQDFRSAFQIERAAKGEISFNYALVMKRYMFASGKLNDILRKKPNDDVNNFSSIQFSLPKLKLPEFSGKPEDWRAFISLFDRMVHLNVNIENGLKIEYLKTCVKGDAAKIINDIDATAENYASCYSLLRKRFDNKRELLGKMIDNILLLPKMKIESADLLKKLHDTVYESIMSIKNMGISVENWDSLLTHILTHKLDSSTLIHYECQLKDVREPQTLDSFLKYSENRFMALNSANSKTAYIKKN